MKFLNTVKARTLWIIVAVDFVITMALVYAATIVPSQLKALCIVLMAIGFISLTVLIQLASHKSFSAKMKKEPRNPKEYQTELDILEVLKKNKYKAREKAYGVSYLKIAKPNAFKVSIITDSDSYFNPPVEVQTEGEPELDKCDRMLCFEIFMNIKEEDIDRLGDYSIQGRNVYYTAFYKVDEKTFICANEIEPLEVHKRNYESLMKELGFIK